MAFMVRMAVCVFLCLSAGSAVAATPAQIEQARAKGLAWLMTHQRGDGSWQAAPGLEVQSTSEALNALMNAGIYWGSSFGAALTWLQNADAASVDSLSRKISVLASAGTMVQSDLVRLAAMKNWQYSATWGAYTGYETSFPDTPLAQSAIRTASIWYPTAVDTAYPDYVTELLGAIYCEMLPGQLNAGGWSYVEPATASPYTTAAIIPTAFTLLQLQLVSSDNPTLDSDSCDGTSSTPSYSLKSAITKGVNWLLTARKNPDGGFGDNGASTILETALAYQVLTAVNSTDLAKDAALNYLISQQDSAGSWRGDPLQTAAVLKAFDATRLTDSDGDGIPDAVEAILGTDPHTVQTLIPGNGQSVSGVTAPVFIAAATVNRPFTTTLTASGGTPPYTWGIASGRLPTGLGLAGATGVISGTPTEMGAFNFIYSVTDTNGSGTSTSGQISVERAAIRTAFPSLEYFGSLLGAYGAQTPGDTVYVQLMTGTYAEDVLCDKDVALTLSGGYDDTFSNQNGVATLNGSLTIIDGSVAIDTLVIY